MYGYCKVVKTLNTELLDKEHFESGEKSFGKNAKYVYDLYPIA